MDALSALAEDALCALVEGTSSRIPTASLPHDAVSELEEALIVSVDDDVVSLHDAIGIHAVARLEATPCRLPLLLGSDPDRSEAIAAHLSAVLDLSLSSSAGIIPALTEVPAVVRLLDATDPESRDYLADLVARGGFEASNGRVPEALLDLGLVWETTRDVRIPSEVLLCLLRVQLQERAAGVRTAWRSFEAHRESDNLHLLPLRLERTLGTLTSRLSETGLGILDDEHAFRASTGLFDPAFNAPALAARLKQLGPAPANIVSALTELFVLGIGDPTPLDRLFDGEGREDDEGLEDECWAVLSPHALAEFDDISPRPGAAAATTLLRLAAQQVLTSCRAGSIVPIDRLTELLVALASLTRCAARLVAQPYFPEADAPDACDARRAVCDWVTSWPASLGWARPEIPFEAELLGDAPPPGNASNLSLFGPSTTADTPRVVPAEEARCGCLDVPFDRCRISARPADASHLAAAVLTPWSASVQELLACCLQPAGAACDGEVGCRLRAPSLGSRPTFGRELAEFLRASGASLSAGGLLLESYLTTLPHVQALDDVERDHLVTFVANFAPARATGRDRAPVKRVFDMLEALHAWRADRTHGFPPVADLRKLFEGPWLRTRSAQQAIAVFQPSTAPPELLASRPEPAHDGAVRLISCAPNARRIHVRPLSGTTGDLVVALDPRPMALLRPGDHIDGQFVRYGDVTWLNQVRSVSVYALGGSSR